MTMAHEDVYARILARVDKEEMSAQCRGVVQKEAKLVDRRIRGARRALQHAYDVSAAVQQLPGAQAAHVAVAMAPTVKEIEEMHARLAAKVELLVGRVLQQPLAEEEVDAAVERAENKALKLEPQLPLAAVGLEMSHVPTPTKGKKRRLRQDSTDSPRKPPRPGRHAIQDDEESETAAGPHRMSIESEGDEETDGETEPAAVESVDDEPIELDLLESESDTEADLATYLEKARRLRKISSDRRMSELPGLIRAVLAEVKREEWTKMPRDLLGALSATLGASTTLKPAQREEIRPELNQLRAVAEKIDVTTAKRYPTLLGSKVRFLHSVEELAQDESVTEPESSSTQVTPPVQFDAIEDLHRATQELAARTQTPGESNSLEEIDSTLQLVDHVFDNPSAARSKRYVDMVDYSLQVLLTYMQGIPRRTRRKQQCEQLLLERLEQLKSEA